MAWIYGLDLLEVLGHMQKGGERIEVCRVRILAISDGNAACCTDEYLFEYYNLMPYHGGSKPDILDHKA